MSTLGNVLGNKFFKKLQKMLKIPANCFSELRLNSSFISRCCEEFRSGQKLQKSIFESAAYANFATPAALKTNYLVNSTTFRLFGCCEKRCDFSSDMLKRGSFPTAAR